MSLWNSATAQIFGPQIAARLAAGASAQVRSNLRAARQDSGYAYVIHPLETAVGLTESALKFGFDPGDARRYGFVGDGVTDDTAALQTLFTVCQQGMVARVPFSGTGKYIVSGPLFFDGSGGIVIEAAPHGYLAPVLFSGTGSSDGSTTTLTIDSATAARISPGVELTGALAAGFPAGATVIKQLTGTSGGAGTYEMSAASVSALAAGTAVGTTYTVINIATKTVSFLTDCYIGIVGGGVAANGVQLGNTSQNPTVCNIQRSRVQFIDVESLAGFGIQMNAPYDSHFGNLHANYCGSATQYAFSINNAGDTANQFSIDKVQVEAATQKAVFIDQVLTSSIAQLHAERAAGVAGTYTHVFGGDTVSYGPMYLEGATNGSIYLNCAGCLFQGIEVNDSPVTYENPVNAPFGASANLVLETNCAALTEAAGNVGSWVFQGCTVQGAAGVSSGTLLTRFRDCQLSSINPADGGFYAEGSSISGTWAAAGAGSVSLRDCTLANFPTSPGVTLENCTVSGAFSTAYGQTIRARACKFEGLVTFDGASCDWRSDGCEFSAGATYNAGGTGVLFGPSDSFGAAVTAGYLLENPQAGGANTPYKVGDRGFNPAPTAAGSFAWVCTAAGTPGTWTNLTLP